LLFIPGVADFGEQPEGEFTVFVLENQNRLGSRQRG
jgi:hypothetical protein